MNGEKEAHVTVTHVTIGTIHWMDWVRKPVYKGNFENWSPRLKECTMHLHMEQYLYRGS
jgi:hypothetical protein